MFWCALVGLLLFSSFKTPTAHGCNVTFSWLKICRIWRSSELMLFSSIVLRSEIHARLGWPSDTKCSWSRVTCDKYWIYWDRQRSSWLEQRKKAHGQTSFCKEIGCSGGCSNWFGIWMDLGIRSHPLMSSRLAHAQSIPIQGIPKCGTKDSKGPRDHRFLRRFPRFLPCLWRSTDGSPGKLRQREGSLVHLWRVVPLSRQGGALHATECRVSH